MHASQIHPKLTAVFNELDDADIVWFLLRGEDSPLALGGDVDLLVAASDFSLIHALVERMGFARIPAWGHGSHAFFLTYEPATDVWIKLDVVTELAFGPGFVLPTHTESECLARRERAAGVPVLCDQDAAWALLLHRLIDERASIRSIDPGRLAELAPLAAGDGALRFAAELEAAGATVAPPDDPIHHLAAIDVCAVGEEASEAPPDQIQPLYLRPPDAKKWLERDRGRPAK